MRKTMMILSVYGTSMVMNLCNAQSPSILWWYDTNDASYGQSAAGDLDGDGLLEIVFGCYRRDSSVHVLNAENGTLLWKYNTHAPGAEGCNDAAPLIIDVDNDSLPEVIVPGSCNPVTFCFNGKNGAVRWQCPTMGSDSPPTVADLDNDGKPEILHGEFGGYVICINGENGSASWEIPVDLNSWIQTAPTIADLDGDGKPDFVVGTWNFSHADSIYAYRGYDHAVLWTFPVSDVMYHGTAVADLDDDSKPELVIGSYNDTLYCLNGEDGSAKWKYAATGGYIGAPASIGDIDNDGRCEVVFVSGYVVTALSDAGIHKWHYNIPGYSGAFRGAALADINEDEYPDVIFGTDNGKVIALSGNGGGFLWSVDLAAHYGNPDFGLDHAPLVADFDQDDTLEVFIAGGYGVYPFENNFGRAYMIKAGKGHGPEWRMFQRDIHRQSSLCTDTISTAVYHGTGDASPVSVFPNPSGSSATILFNSAGYGNHTLILYDAKGEIVRKMEGIRGAEVTIGTMELAEGMYFFQLMNRGGMAGHGKLFIRR